MRTAITSTLRTPARRSLATTARLGYASNTDNPGKNPKTHVTDSKDELDIQSEASGKGQRARESGDAGLSSATSQKDPGGSNKKASEKTKAPGPVIGMQDERGGVSSDEAVAIAQLLTFFQKGDGA